MKSKEMKKKLSFLNELKTKTIQEVIEKEQVITKKYEAIDPTNCDFEAIVREYNNFFANIKPEYELKIKTFERQIKTLEGQIQEQEKKEQEASKKIEPLVKQYNSLIEQAKKQVKDFETFLTELEQKLDDVYSNLSPLSKELGVSFSDEHHFNRNSCSKLRSNLKGYSSYGSYEFFNYIFTE